MRSHRQAKSCNESELSVARVYLPERVNNRVEREVVV